MNLLKFLLFLVGMALVCGRQHVPKLQQRRVVVCYLGSWANYRQGQGRFVIEDIDPRLCTHLIYGFAKLGPGYTIEPYDPYLDLRENYGLGAYERFNNLRAQNPQLRTLIAIGGWNEGSEKYSRMASSAESRRNFAQSCVQFLKKHKFDGLDLDWEYPAQRGGKPDDKKNFVLLLEELRSAFRSDGFLLTAAVSAGQSTIDSAYDIPAISRNLDLINLMTYDFHGGWDRTTGHHSPMRSSPDEPQQLNVEYAVDYWLKNGAPPSKLVLGMPLYGRNFQLQDTLVNGVGAPITDKGPAGPFTQETGFLGYNEICQKIKQEEGWTVVVDKYAMAPYAFNGRHWVGYDDEKSLITKVKFLIQKNLAGAMVWSIETDDFLGKCHGRRYSLMSAINAALNGSVTKDIGNSIQPEIETSPADFRTHPPGTPSSTNLVPRSSSRPDLTTNFFTLTSSTSTSVPSNDDLPCPKPGYFAHPSNCILFYACQPLGIEDKYQRYLLRCSTGTVFSQTLQNCVFPADVPGCEHVLFYY